MGDVNCLRCKYRHTDNGNCTAVGGFCTAVPAAHCPLLREYLDTELTPQEVLSMKFEWCAMMDALNSIGGGYTRLRELAEADREGRVTVEVPAGGGKWRCMELPPLRDTERPMPFMPSVFELEAQDRFCRCGPKGDISNLTSEEDFRKMLSETDNVLCPECWQNQPQKKEFSINIRETLETQVAVEAESEEAALREVERCWKNGEYILDADNFQGVDFWAADHPPVKHIDAQEKIDWFELFLSRMRDYSDGEVWGNGDELMCKTEAIADAMCDLLFQLYAAQGEEVVFHTGYYDPVEDARSGEEDRCTGWWYVDCD